MRLVLKFMIVLLCVAGCSACSVSSGPVTSQSTVFQNDWNSGLNKSESTFQTQSYNQNTLVIRQSLRSSFEAPFIYLLLGQTKALLIDTGDESGDLRTVVDQKIGQWQQAHAQALEPLDLIVMHSHAHSDHVAGDAQFNSRPNTVVVGHDPQDVASFFNIKQWPTETVTLDLGGRIVDILPTPGHHDSHVMVYDRATKILFSGDTIYPGRLYFQCHKLGEFTQTIERLAQFAQHNTISWIMGGHIEMAADAGKSFASNRKSRKNERQLEMTPATITAIQSALQEMDDQPRVTVFDEFILFPHPADPTGKSPPDWCLREISSK